MKRLEGKFNSFLYAVCALWLFGFVALPFLAVLAISFLSRGYSDFVEPVFTIQNYLQIFDFVYLKVFLSSTYLALLTSLLCILVAYPFAYFLARSNERAQAIGLALVMIPFWTSSLIRSYALIAILKTNGFLNQLLIKLGLIDSPLSILYTDWAVMIGMVYTLLPFAILPIFSSVQGLSKNLLEASQDLGATAFQSFKRVILPLTSPGVMGAFLLTFFPALGLFFIPDLLGGAKTLVLGAAIRDQFLMNRNWPLGSALSVLLTLGMFLLLAFNSWVKKRVQAPEEEGAF